MYTTFFHADLSFLHKLIVLKLFFEDLLVNKRRKTFSQMNNCGHALVHRVWLGCSSTTKSFTTHHFPHNSTVEFAKVAKKACCLETLLSLSR